MGERSSGRAWWFVSVWLVLSVVLAGCSAAGASGSRADGAPGQGGTSTAAPSVPVAPLRVTVSPSGDEPAPPGVPVTVSASGGRLTAVLLQDDRGVRYLGTMQPGQRRWTSTGTLPAGVQVTYHATARDSRGAAHTAVGTVRTLRPRVRLTTAISPLSGQTVGVGMPIVVRFNADVTDHAAVESRLTVHASRPVVGAWSWAGDREVHWRPREFWPAGTKVRLDVNLAGVDAGKGVWGMSDRTVPFTIGPSMISVVDVKSHEMKVYRDGRLLRTVPVTTGKGGFLTRGGVKVILEKYRHEIMDAATVGISRNSPEYYRLDVPYAMRVTWSGEFVHAAPWSTGDQGRVNVSHGCVGMSMANGRWLFDHSNVGDVVRVVGSPRRLESGNGYTDWNVSWARWTSDSATGPAPAAPLE